MNQQATANISGRGWSVALSLVVAGLGLGWLVGLSLTPVIGAVLTSLLGLVAGVVAGLSVLSTDKVKIYNTWPMALLILGIAVGASAGVLARTNDLLGQIYPQTAVPGAAPEAPADRTGLFLGSVEECERLSGQPDSALPSALQTSDEAWAPRAAAAFAGDPAGMRKVVEVICAS